MVKNPPASAGDVRDVGLIPGSEEPLEKGRATHASVLTWEIPRTEEPGGRLVHKFAESDMTEATLHTQV